jgi:hypothetical protein
MEAYSMREVFASFHTIGIFIYFFDGLDRQKMVADRRFHGRSMRWDFVDSLFINGLSTALQLINSG